MRPFFFKGAGISLSLLLGILVHQRAFSESRCDHKEDEFHCVEYIKNYDGDTVTMHIPFVHPLLGESISVRVLGIDAPEVRTLDECEKKAGYKAQRLVEKILMNAKRIDLKAIGRDKFFRVLAYVIADGQDVGEELLKANLAVPYDGGTKEPVDWCHR